MQALSASPEDAAFSLEEGIFNPWLKDPTPKRLLDHELVRALWRGIDPSQLWDCHVHIAGIGDGKTGVDTQAQVLSEIRRYNPLLFDFVLKRSLVSGGQRFTPVVFESRRLFEPKSI